jgi:hypothetical protein
MPCHCSHNKPHREGRSLSDSERDGYEDREDEARKAILSDRHDRGAELSVAW